MKTSQNRLVVVLGMHRSGTSAVTRGLGLLGVGLGSNLHPAGFDNPKGFWEDRGVLEVNEELLALQGSAYDRLGLAQQTLPASADLSRLKLKAAQLVQERLAAGEGMWGFKDPRTCRLLSFWLQIFAATESRVSFVIALRNPASVAASLGNRNETPTEKSYWLWLQHMLPAVLQSRGMERVVVDYDAFMDAPYAQLKRIAEAIDLPLPAPDTVGVREFENEFLESGLRHTRFSLQQLKLDSRAPAAVCELYQVLSAVARDEAALESEELQMQLAALEHSLGATASLVYYANALEDERIRLWQDLSKRDSGLQALQATLAGQATQHEEQLVSLHLKVEERDRKIEELGLAITQRERQVAALEHGTLERDAQLTALHLNVGARDSRIEQLQAELQERNAQASVLLQQMAEAEANSANLLAQATAERDAQVAALGQQLVEVDTQHAFAAAHAMAAREQQMQEFQTKLGAHEAQILELHDAVGTRDSRIEQLQGELQERNAHASVLQQLLADADAQVAALGQQLEEVDTQHAIAAAQAMAEREQQMQEFQIKLIAHEAQILELLHAVDTRDSRIEQLQAELQDRFAQASVLQKLLAEADAQVAALRRQLLELDTQTATAAAQAMAAREQQMQEFQIKLSAHEAQILELHHAVGARDSQIAALKHEVRTQLEQIETMMQSSSWRLTKPLRALRRGLPIGSSPVLRGMLSDRARQVWRHLPMSVSKKQKLKSAIFQGVPFLFRHTLAYRTWVNCQSSETRAGLPALQVPQRANVLEPVPYVPLLQAEPLFQRQAKLICFYLPQFHPIPENDAWWGEGFTEWTNVRPAQPQFEGHYQPRIPGELGYYSLLDPAVQRRQIELARLYGIEGFCFYFYWFGGKRLLETPTENYLNNPELDLPFCLCWANENWSRRWDGLDSEVLMAQNHSAEDDLAFISYIAKYLRDPRYIRIDSKPLLLVYRPSLLPDMRATTARWRTWCRENGVGEIYLAYTQSFETVDPRDYDFDAAIEFPPNNSAPPNITDSIKPITEDFSGIVYDWRVFPERSENYTPAKYTLFRSVCPAWDNTARRKNRGAIFHHNTPQLYQRWLTNAIDDTCRHRANPDERIIFINAWNEWAEGAYLEPDARFGYAYLQVTRNALAPPAHESGNPRRLVLVTHDAYPHGAQLLTLNMARVLHEQFGFHVDLVCLGDGPLKPDFARHAQLHDLAGIDPRGPEAMALAKRLFAEGQRHALVNTTVSGFFLQTLARSGLRCVALVHELRGVLDQMGLHDQAHAIALHAFKAVFPANEVADSFLAAAPMDPDKIIVRPQGLYKRRNSLRYTADDRSRLRERLSLPPEAKVVLGVGYADHRKGVDLFVRAGLLAARQQPDVYWVWIGHWERNMQAVVSALLAKAPEVAGRFVFPGLQEDTDVFYGGADVFALTSREDPFPSVVLESLDAGVPVVAFEGSGGCLPMIKDGCGLTAPYEDVDAFAAAVNRLLQDNELRSSSGEQGRARVARDFSFRHYLFDLLDLLGCGFRRVSVVVPNFNYERFIEERLASVVQQDYPVYELLFLDDCSSDQSVDRARRYLSGQPVDFKILANQMNSGSVFKQWKRGIDHSRTELIWIAEADDACDPSMLTHVVKGFDVPGVVLSYCESKQMAEDGSILDDSYRAYVADVSEQRWNSPYVNDGLTEISEALSIKNSIPNASAVVFDAKRLKSVLDMHLDQISSYRVAGDWMTYILTLREGKIAYCPLSLNLHRRHGRSVTIGSFDRDQLDEIQRVQTFIADTFEVSEEKKSIAKHYLSSLVKQFGL